MALDTASATPLFQQLAEELRQAIRTGEYPPGSQLPTEHQLCDRYQVSRVTVRKALEELSPVSYTHLDVYKRQVHSSLS